MSSDLEHATESYAIWDEFLSVWPASRVMNMSIDDYTKVGSQDSFTMWLESRTKELGSIWGGSSFKFGVFNRKDSEDKQNTGKYSYTSDYAWDNSLGNTAEEAFQVVKTRLLEVISAAQSGKFPDMQSRKLWPIVELKVAFLYQDRQSPILASVYTREMIESYLGVPKSKHNGDWEGLYRELLTQRGDRDLLEFSKNVWEEGTKRLDAKIFTPTDAEEMLLNAWTPIGAGTKYIIGFETPSGRQIALSRDMKAVQVYVEPVQVTIPGCKLVRSYDDQAPRSSNITSQAPKLSVGNPAVAFQINTRQAMQQFMENYENADGFETEPRIVPSESLLPKRPDAPLNQILYGPPGTGKTYHTVNKALEILDPLFLREHEDNRPMLKKRFDEFKERGRIGFVTFHQSFSYEDFVEGLKATANNETGQVSYEIEDGVFKRICDTARNIESSRAQSPAPISLEGRQVWKMSLGNTQGEDSYVYDDCLEEKVIRLGYGHELNFKDAKDWNAVKQAHQKAGIEVSDTDYSVKVTNYFVNEMAKGDLVIISDGNLKLRAIAEVTSDYFFDDQRHDWYRQTRQVKWLRTFKQSIPVDQLMDKIFSQQTLYRLGKGSLKPSRLLELLGTPQSSEAAAPIQTGDSFNNYIVTDVSSQLLRLTKPNGSKLTFDMEMLAELAQLVLKGRISLDDIRQKNVFDKVPETNLERYLVNGYNNILSHIIERMTESSNTKELGLDTASTDAYVLIIDEINRGNIANIFGELITLIEESKRTGRQEALEVSLPYSKTAFSVPDNLYLIGTMNTADRSLVHMDTALRRRFNFEAMMPREDLLEKLPLLSGSIDVARMLKTINERITVLYDREHTIGHSFFYPLFELDAPTVEDLAKIFNRQILPLLEEYFFEDWSKIRMVLNDDSKPEDAQIITRIFDQQKIESLFGTGVQLGSVEGLYQRNAKALLNPVAYTGIYSVTSD